MMMVDSRPGRFLFLLPFVVLQLLLLPSLCYCQTQVSCNIDDRNSLLSLYLNVSSSTARPLNWSPSTDCCGWEGVSCDNGNGRVTQLWLPSRGLGGIISSSIVNLTSLSSLNLSHNSLSGPLPTGFFSSLPSLQTVDLSYNSFYGLLSYPFDSSNGNNSIQTLDLSSNRFHGPILSVSNNSFLRLTSFNVSNNTLNGQIPSDICASVLDFSNNDFTENIPSTLGQCSNLKIFRAGFNNLSGTIPDDIYGITSLQQLSLPVNSLSGHIDGVVSLTNLTVLDLYSNNFDGLIPQDIGKLAELVSLQLHINNFSGSLPSSLSNCIRLRVLNLRVNQLGGNLSDFDFSKLLQLTTLDLGNNLITGNLPSSLYSCKSLTAIRVAGNKLSGEILPDIAALQVLSFLSISNNSIININGALRNLMGCKNLTALIVSKNFLNELMPNDDSLTDADAFQNLQVLAFGGCQLIGQVPTWLANLKNLEVLDLSVNQITGFIPGWLGNLTYLFYLDLSSNFISGEFPKELTRLPALTSGETKHKVNRSYLELPVFVMPNNATNQQYNQLSSLPPAFYLRNNSLSGNIPAEIGQLKYLHVLDLSNNNFSGNIPDQISNLTNLEKLDLSGNDLSGVIPASLKGLHFLSSFSVANNSLQGQIPSGGQFDTFSSSSFDGNPWLCGPIVQRSCSNPTAPPHSVAPRKSPNTRLIIGLVLGTCFGAGLFITVLALWILSKRRIIPRGDLDKIELEMLSNNSNYGVSPGPGKDASLIILFSSNCNEIKDLTISELLKATDNFNQENIVGCGGFGLVYKAVLANGTKLAVKKLSGDMGLMEREFRAEVEALSTAQHENLVSLRGYCVHEGFRLLIYSFMENGSLDYWLHEKADGASQLDWPTRLKIVRGASRGLAYMHQICEPHIVHRDIKSSNILLDEKFEAHVADFGLSRLILPYQTHVTTELVGTLGYIPPEYGQAWVATLRGDMYSFGVVMLELLTDKRPVEVFKPKLSRELVSWVQQMRNEGKQDQIFDPFLRGKGFDEEMLQVLDMACMCVNHNPFKRPTIKEVADWLKNIGTTDRNGDKG
ncbi:Leucine-rich receptor-like protein kinase family protein putative isoform 1 [Tripterygium wilfordii]|uniref:non-specific serine/threonine protein kinase n=1 Tax=Tripterygium wilfordii TaxID=458696 RepID=A0A7J7CD36_TRIWF|nr:tyrosine-sulfated glycopeptide receptor 1 [Tripterygium wilfordii]KAF5732071.1 Leucine-rich receptor-like protein kinase family protein putative isoform 1 [Tripterygium wilfordii]